MKCLTEWYEKSAVTTPDGKAERRRILEYHKQRHIESNSTIFINPSLYTNAIHLMKSFQFTRQYYRQLDKSLHIVRKQFYPIIIQECCPMQR